MKHVKFAFAVTVLVLATFVARANDEKFIQAMRKNIDAIMAARDIAAYQEAANGFERIASAEKSRWEPLYYAAFGYVMMANLEADGSKKDLYLDEAMTRILRAKEIVPAESELLALEGFTNMLRITVDPQSRGMVYSAQVVTACTRALELNPNNPRALAFLAQMQFGTAQFFGSPFTEACETNAKALTAFQNYKSDNPLAPVWGVKMAEGLSERCK